LNKNFINWAIFIALSIIWGSSFVLIKEGLVSLSAYQVAALRIVFAGIVLLPTAVRYFKEIPKNKLAVVFMSGFLGSMFPAFLFCIAEEVIDSAVTGTLNSLTPIFVIITGVLFFKTRTSVTNMAGIAIAITGSVLLLLSKGNLQQSQGLFYISLVVIATICYGINVNMVHRNLGNIPSLHIAAVALVLNAIPALIVLIASGYFKLDFTNRHVLASTGFAAILGIVGTAIATIIFYVLVKRAGTIFSAMVTYGIPVVANIWGVFYDDNVGVRQFLCLAIILAGVFVVNLKVKRKEAAN